MLQLKVTPVVGLPQFTGWSQVAESTVSVSARLVVVYAVSGKHAGSVGRDINEKISEFYFYDAAGLHEFLQQLVAYSHENDCKIYFACCVLSRTASVFATYGGSVFLKRSEKSGRILVSETEIKIVAGRFLPEDTFVLTTLQADQFLSEIQLKFQQGYDTDIIITSIVPGLHQQDDSSLSAIVFIAQDLDQATTQATREPDFEISHSPSHSHSDSQQQEQQYQQQQTEPKSSQESNNSGFDAQLSVEVDPLDPTLNKKIEKLKKLGIFIVRQLKKLLSLLLLVLQYCARSLVSLVKYTARLPKCGVITRCTCILNLAREQSGSLWRLLPLSLLA